MDVIGYTSYHLVKGEDLNHHGTLFAGRSAEWFVEAGFIAAASLTRPENIVCMQIHTMTFSSPVKRGEIVKYASKIVLTGRSRIVASIQMWASDRLVVDGFITFVNVDAEGHPLPHGVEIVPTRPEDMELQERARALPR